MTNVVSYASALMGSGKTQSFIAQIDTEDNVVYSVPKIELSESIAKRIREAGNECETINSKDNNPIPVRKRVEKALTEGREGSVIIITHATLMNINAEYLQGWKVVVDEVPEINRNEHKRVGGNTFDKLFSDLLDPGIEELLSVCTYKPELEMTVRGLYADSLKTGNQPYSIVLGGLLSETGVVTKENEKDGSSVTFLVHDHYDYSHVINNAEEFHVMGNGIEKTLFHLWVKKAGYDIEVSKYMPSFRGYKIPPTLVPLVKGDKFSKKMMLTKEDGTESDNGEFNKDCLGWKLLEKALEYHHGEPVLVQVFKWMKVFPFTKYENVEVTEFDLRGLNDYADNFHRTVNLIHGNPEPIVARMNRKLMEIMGIDVKDGEEAIRHARYIEPIAQYMLRTNMRKGDSQTKATVTIVPNMEVAEALQDTLQIKCNIDKKVMVDPPKKAPTKAKLAREEKKTKAKEMDANGLSAREIAKNLGMSNKTISNWIKTA
jgi:hypothetical protein